MARIFSWKVSPTKYAYLIKDSMFGTEESCVRSRITDVSQLRQMADICNDLTESQYRDKYEIVKAEVNGTAGLWSMVNDYQEYYEASTAGYSDVVILSGVGMEGESDGLWQGGDEDEKWRELEEYIDKLMEEYRSQISADTAAIREAIAAAASADIGDAMNDLHQASERLDEIEQNLANAARDAQNALDAARSLIGLGADGITPEAIANVIQSTNRYDEWLNQNGSATTQMIVDYDALRSRMGGIGQAVDAAGGYLSYLGYSMNILSGTVGTTERTMAALSGTILDQATWYDEAMSSMTQMGERIDAQQGIIEQYGSYMEGLSGGMVNYVNETIDAKNASITNEIYHRLSGTNENLTTIRNEMNAMSGFVRTEISRINGTMDSVTGNITTIHTDMNAMNGRLETAMTIANTALSAATDMRETWTKESGMLRTVADLVIRTDENGDPIFYYVGASGLDKTRVYKMEGLKNGLPYYNTKKDGSGIEYVEDVIPDYLTQMMSYVQQTVSSITFNVSSGDVIAALRLEVTHEGQAIIYGLADEIRLDAKVIANSLSAKTANIGGIEIGKGEIIYRGTNGQNFYKLRRDGIIEARGALIHGSISATSGTFTGTVHAKDGDFKGSISAETGYFKGALCAATGTFKGALQAATGSFNGAVTANSLTLGSGAYGDLNTWVNGKGYTTSGGVQNQISNYLTTNGYATEDEAAQIAANAIATGISFVETSTTTNGVTKHIAHIGNNTYDWYTIDTGDYLILDAWRGSSDHTKSGVCISTNGLLQANNAIIYGKIYASEGEFKGAITANSLTLTGSATNQINSLITAATDGFITENEATGLIQAQAGTAAEQALANSTGFVRVDKWMSAGTGSAKTSFFVSRDGLLQAQNAIISGSVYATNGYFSGEISAADIKLNGKSLVLSNESNNTFSISEESIKVQKVPRTVVGNTTTNPYGQSPRYARSVAYFYTETSTQASLPGVQLSLEAYQYGSYAQYYSTSCTFKLGVFSGGSIATQENEAVDFSKAICSGYPITLSTFESIGSTGATGYFSGSSVSSLRCLPNRPYVLMVELDTGTSTEGARGMATSKQFNTLLVPDTTDEPTFFNIGKNGMQIFLNGGFYFTVAYDEDAGAPLIAFGGKKDDGTMVGLICNKSGIMVLGNGSATSLVR